jgi:hypothetical protein
MNNYIKNQHLKISDTIRQQIVLIRKIRLLILIFMIALVLSGITAFPIESELKFLTNYLFDKESIRMA